MSSDVGDAWQEAFANTPPVLSQDTVRYIKKFPASAIWRYISAFANFAPESLALEAGCGSGKLSLALALLGFKVTALDYAKNALDAAAFNKKELEARLKTKLNITFVTGNLEDLSLPVDYFDLVLNEGVIEHWLEKKTRVNVLKQMTKVTKPGGTVVVIVPNGAHPLSPWWEKNCAAFYESPPMVNYSAVQLKQELELAGLKKVVVDGLYPWRTIDFYSQRLLNKLIGFMLQKTIPLPRILRQKFGVHLIGLGVK